jgi:hypothetical protein
VHLGTINVQKPSILDHVDALVGHIIVDMVLIRGNPPDEYLEYLATLDAIKKLCQTPIILLSLEDLKQSWGIKVSPPVLEIVQYVAVPLEIVQYLAMHGPKMMNDQLVGLQNLLQGKDTISIPELEQKGLMAFKVS